MSSKFSQFDTYMRFFYVELIINLAAAVAVGYLARRIWVVIFFLVPALFMMYGVFSRKYKILKSGATGYFYSFDSSKDCKIFDKDGEVRQSFFYLGVSGDSILELYKKWISNNDPALTYHFLLMDPDSPNLKWQIAFEKGVPLGTNFGSINGDLVNIINSEASSARLRIKSCIEVLKTLQPYRNGKLNIRLYAPFTPYWMYIVDEKSIYLGIMEKGKRGYNSPVLKISKRQNYASLFDTFRNSWDKLWADAIEIK